MCQGLRAPPRKRALSIATKGKNPRGKIHTVSEMADGSTQWLDLQGAHQWKAPWSQLTAPAPQATPGWAPQCACGCHHVARKGDSDGEEHREHGEDGMERAVRR